MKYLGLTLVCDRLQLIKSAKNKCKKFVHFVKGRIRTNSQELTQLIIAAYFRSLLVYYITPLYAAGAIGRDALLNMEANFVRKQLLIPPDIKNDSVRHVGSNFSTSIADCIQTQASRIRFAIPQQQKVETKRAKGSFGILD